LRVDLVDFIADLLKLCGRLFPIFSLRQAAACCCSA